MDDLRRIGLRKFVEDYLQDIEQDTLLRPGRSDRELGEAIRQKVQNAISDTFGSRHPSPRQAIWHLTGSLYIHPASPASDIAMTTRMQKAACVVS
jgi:hypothetical protein